MHRSLRTLVVALLAAVATAMAALPASAAELVTAELEGTVNEVTVEQGKTASFTVALSATGNVACSSTHTAAVHTAYAVSEAGAVSSSTPSTPQSFSASPGTGNNCPITWSGAPTPLSVAANVSVHANTPTGVYSVVLREANGNVIITDSNSTGGKLDDVTGTTLNIRVVAPAAPPNTAPTVSVTGVTDGATYEYGSVPAAGCSVVDAEDGNSTPDPVLSAFSGPLASYGLGAQTATCSYTDGGGLSGSAAATYTVQDTAPPDVALVGGPQDGASYYFGAVPAAPTCTASDNVALAGPCTVDTTTTTVGTHTVTASATDVSGNVGTDAATYTVLAWTATGFKPPVDNDTLNIVKAGSTVPMKFEVHAGDRRLTDTAVVKSFLAKQVNCASMADLPKDAIELYSATAGTALRWDADGNQFIQNWKIPQGANVCYRVTLLLQDGSSLVASFKTK